jgi:chromosome segregation ATPase
MKKMLKKAALFFGAVSLIFFLGACYFEDPEMPGDISEVPGDRDELIRLIAELKEKITATQAEYDELLAYGRANAGSLSNEEKAEIAQKLSEFTTEIGNNQDYLKACEEKLKELDGGGPAADPAAVAAAQAAVTAAEAAVAAAQDEFDAATTVAAAAAAAYQANPNTETMAAAQAAVAVRTEKQTALNEAKAALEAAEQALAALQG